MEKLKAKLSRFHQDHLLRFWEELTDEKKVILENDLQELDLEQIEQCCEKAKKSLTSAEQQLLDNKMQPVEKEKISSRATISTELLMIYQDRGHEEITNNRVAVLVLAGGQGTRLGVDYPKGMYNVGLPSGKTLFELLAERITSLENVVRNMTGKRGRIFWYILTSEATHDTTVSYFQRKSYFQRENFVKIFKQGLLPCFTFEGKILMDSKYQISKAPDGNGGLYRALENEDMLNHMIAHGIRYLHVHSVDNILMKVADPVFIGYCVISKFDCGVKVVEKTYPQEAVGIVCKVDDHYQVVEYSEITEETAELRQDNGKLMYNAANICNHYFTIDFLQRIVFHHENELELHIAKKKIPFINDEGERIIPQSPNGIKMEKFIFDVFRFAENFGVWQVFRECEFSPLKNADSVGYDCPATARKDLLKLHKTWLLNAGVREIYGDVEISPTLSYDGEGLQAIAKKRSLIGPKNIEK